MKPVVFVLTIGAVFAGCYTQLYRQNKTDNEIAKGPRPDIAITGITSSVHRTIVADDPHPLPTTEFRLEVKNLGPGDFIGSIAINFADNWSDIDHNTLPIVGGIGSFRVNVGDSITIKIARQHTPYWSGTPFRFILRTDDYPPHSFDPAYYFGRQPIAEVSLENNVADFTMP